MASARELWIVLKGRDEASRLVRSFAGNVRSAGNSVKAAQLQSQAAAIRQRAEMLKTNGAMAQQIQQINSHVTGLDKQARALTAESARAKEYRDTIMKTNGTTNAQIDAINKHITALDRRSAVIRSDAAVQRNAMAQVQNDLNGQVAALKTHATALDQQARSFRDADRAALNHAKSLERLSSVAQQGSTMAIGMGFAFAGAAAGGALFMYKSIKAAIDYEKQVRATATQVTGFKAGLGELSDMGIKVAETIAVKFEDIQPALYDIFSSLEVGTKQAGVLLEAFSKGAVAGEVSISKVSRAVIGEMNAFQRPVSDVNHLLDMQFQLVKFGIGTYAEWVDRIGLVTPSAVRAGQSIETMTAALATATRMGIPAASSAASVARAMDAMSNPKAIIALKNLGVSSLDAAGKMRPMNLILHDFRDALDKMPVKDRVAAILDVFKSAGGTIQARRFLQNILLVKGNLESFDMILGQVKNSSGSMEKAYELMANSTAAKSELLRNKWMSLKVSLGQALLPSITDLISKLGSLLDWFNKLPEGTKGIIAQFVLWGTVAGAVVGALLFIVSGVGFMIAAFATAGTTILVVFGVITAFVALIVGLGAAFILVYKHSEGFRNNISALGKAIKGIFDAVKDTIAGLVAAFRKNLEPAFNNLAKVINDKVMPAGKSLIDLFSKVYTPRLREAGKVIIAVADRGFKHIADIINNVVIPVISAVTDWFKKHQDTLVPIIKILAEVGKWFLIIAGIITGVVVAALITIFVVSLGIVVGAILAVVATIIYTIKFFKLLNGWVKDFGDIIVTAASAVGSFFVDVGKAIADFVSSVGDFFAALPGNIWDAIKAIPDVMTKLFSDTFNAVGYIIGYGIGTIIASVTIWPGKIWDVIQGIPDLFSTVWNAVFQFSVNIISTTVNWIINFFSSLLGKTWNVIKGIPGAFSDLWHSVLSTSSSIIHSVIDTVVGIFRGLGGSAKTAVNDLPGKIFGVLRSIVTEAKNIGGDIVRGLINGLTDMLSWAVDRAKDFAHSIVKGVKDALKSGSPSKVFMDLGKFSGIGYIMGLQKSMQGADKIFGGYVSGLTGTNAMQPAYPASVSNIDNGSSKVINNTFNITTQEIDPRKHSAELGWLIGQKV